MDPGQLRQLIEAAVLPLRDRVASLERRSLSRVAPDWVQWDHFAGDARAAKQELGWVGGGTGTGLIPGGYTVLPDAVTTTSSWNNPAASAFLGGAATLCFAYTGNANPAGNDKVMIRRDVTELVNGVAGATLLSSQSLLTIPATASIPTIQRIGFATNPSPVNVLQNTVWAASITRVGADAGDNYVSDFRLHAVWIEYTDPLLLPFWTATLAGSGIVSKPNATPSLVRLATGATANSTAEIGWGSRYGLVGANRYAEALASMAITDAPGAQDVTGLRFISAAGDFAHIGVRGVDSTAFFACRSTSGGGVTTLSTVTTVPVDTNYHRFRIRLYPDRVRFFIDEVLVAEHTVVTTDAVQPRLTCSNGALAVSHTLDVDYFGVTERQAA